MHCALVHYARAHTKRSILWIRSACVRALVSSGSWRAVLFYFLFMGEDLLASALKEEVGSPHLSPSTPEPASSPHKVKARPGNPRNPRSQTSQAGHQANSPPTPSHAEPWARPKLNAHTTNTKSDARRTPRRHTDTAERWASPKAQRGHVTVHGLAPANFPPAHRPSGAAELPAPLTPHTPQVHTRSRLGPATFTTLRPSTSGRFSNRSLLGPSAQLLLLGTRSYQLASMLSASHLQQADLALEDETLLRTSAEPRPAPNTASVLHSSVQPVSPSRT